MKKNAFNVSSTQAFYGKGISKLVGPDSSTIARTISCYEIPTHDDIDKFVEQSHETNADNKESHPHKGE